MSKTRPWDKVAVPVEGRLTTAQALRVTRNHWTVEKVSMTTAPKIVKNELGEIDREKSENPDLFGINNPQQVMTVRVDRDDNGEIIRRAYLGTVGKGYKVVQNHEAFEFFDAALGGENWNKEFGSGPPCVTAVGNLGRYGARIFMIATMPDMLEIMPGDPVERHIMLTNTHDGTGPIEAIFIAYREVNGVMIHAPGGRVRIRHTKNAQKRIATAHRVLHDNADYWERTQRIFRYMAKRDANTQRVREFLEAMFPDKIEKDEEGNEIRKTSCQAEKARESIMNLFESGPGSEQSGATDWGLYNAVAYFVDHERRRAKSQTESGISRWEISVFGSGSDLRERAYRWLIRDYK